MTSSPLRSLVVTVVSSGQPQGVTPGECFEWLHLLEEGNRLLHCGGTFISHQTRLAWQPHSVPLKVLQLVLQVTNHRRGVGTQLVLLLKHILLNLGNSVETEVAATSSTAVSGCFGWTS